MTGYSGTPLAKKLGIKAQLRVLAIDPPDNYRELLGPISSTVSFVAAADHDTDLVHIFSTRVSGLSTILTACRRDLGSHAIVWVSWPKRSARVPSEVTEDVVRDLALPLGFVDVKVCAIDHVWSGLKLVVRKRLR
jgi:hypothetical protein